MNVVMMTRARKGMPGVTQGPKGYARSDTGPIWHARRIIECLKK